MKSAFVSLLIVSLLSMLIILPDMSRVIVFSGTNVDSSEVSTAVYPSNRVFLNQTFDNETVGGTPSGWYITNPQYGNITVVNGGYSGTRRSAMIIDNSTVGYPGPYTYFPEQTKTIGISFAIRPNNNSGNNAVLEISIDDSNFNGAAIVFKDGKIGYRQKNGSFFPLRSSYVFNRWYAIKLILNVSRNVYNIYIDDHLEKVCADFVGACTQLNRIVFNETSGQNGLFLPVAYIDEIFGRQVIEVPGDYSTIQEAIKAASPHDVVFVTGQRTYYENVSITKSIELVGENASTTVIDGSHMQPQSQSDGVVIQADNVFVHELTIRSTPRYGVGIRVYGENSIIKNVVVTNGLGDGIKIIGSNNYLGSSVISDNLQSGVVVSGFNCTLTDNTIIRNDQYGVLLSNSKSNISGNFIGSSLLCGIWIKAGNQSFLVNNTIEENLVGVQCAAGTKNNAIYQNCFIGNDPQAKDYGANKWDDGYPYSSDNKTGGGNYWSDYECFDIYGGVNQDQLCPLCFPSPDGVADRPYNLTTGQTDRYPLFLIQNVSQDPDNVKYDACGAPLHYVGYDVPVNVTARMLNNVNITGAFVLADFDSAQSNFTMRRINDNVWRGTIPGGKYGMLIRYNISAHAKAAVEVNSTDYPLSGPYFVNDTSPPSITNVTWSPRVPDEKQPVIVSVNVTEPMNASGVDSVFLSYKFIDTWWTANMSRASGDIYTASIPPQPGNSSLLFIVSAIDKAGNGNPGVSNNTSVVNLPQLYVTSNTTLPYTTDPVDVDEGVMYRNEGRTDTRLTLSNIGQENLAWNITILVGGDWVRISPTNGVIQPGRNATISMTINTSSCRDPNLYVAELAISANGSILRWAVIVRVLVRDIMIDESLCPECAPRRVNVGTTVSFAFHALWMHNSTDATSGTIKVNDIAVPATVSDTGWGYFNYTLTDPGSKTFSVTEVDFNYVKDNQLYHIKSFVQKALDVTIIWDRVKLVLNLADDRIDVKSEADVTWDSSVYEYDNSSFVGSVYLNDTLTKETVGLYCITASSIDDTKYGLTAFQSNSVFCVWDRFKINVGGVSNKQTQVGKAETVWMMALYEYDNTVFKGGNGTLYLDVYDLIFDGTTRAWTWVWNRTDSMDFSYLYDRWEKTYSFDISGPRAFVVSQKQPIEDRLYNLTAFNDLIVPTLSITWYGGGWPPWPDPLPTLPSNNSDSTEPSPTQSSLDFPFWAFTAIISTLAIGLSIIFATLILSAKRSNRKVINDKMKNKPLK